MREGRHLEVVRQSGPPSQLPLVPRRDWLRWLEDRQRELDALDAIDRSDHDLQLELEEAA
jgi:hypothetical protein